MVLSAEVGIDIPQDSLLAERLREYEQDGETQLDIAEIRALAPFLLKSDKAVKAARVAVDFVEDPKEESQSPALSIQLYEFEGRKGLIPKATADVVSLVVGNSDVGLETRSIELINPNKIGELGIPGELIGDKIDGRFQTALDKVHVTGPARFHLDKKPDGTPMMRVKRTERRKV